MIDRQKLTRLLTREIVSTIVIYRWNLVLMSAATVYSWFTSFPLLQPLPLTAITFQSIYMLTVIAGYIFVLRIGIPTLEIGWSVFGFAVLISFLNQFTVTPALVGTILPGIFMSFGLFMVVLGLYLSYRRLHSELDKSKRAEADRKESERKYRNLFEQSRDAIYISTNNGEFIDVNPMALDLLGYSKEELLNLGMQQLYIQPEDREQFVHEMATNGFVRDFELGLRKKDGREMICLETAVAQRSEQGRIIGYHGILRDITKQKRVEDELRISEERFRSTIQSMNDLIFTADLDGRILAYYPPKDSRDERPATEFIDRRFDEVFPQRVSQNLNYAIESLAWGNANYQYEYSLQVDGQERWYNTVATGQYDAEGMLKAVTIVRRDITERQKADAELREINAALAESKIRAENMMRELEKIRDELQLALDAAKEADRMKSEFLASTSHELRTPLNSIIGFLKLVLDDLCDSPEEEDEFLEHALHSSNLLLSLINDVLDIAKIEAGKMDILPEAVDLQDMFNEIHTLTHVQTEQKKLFYKTTLPAERIVVWADQQKLRQILLNLVGNSVKFTSYGGIELAAEILPGTASARIAVIDTGVGIALDKQEKVFEKFTQADGSTSRKYGGTGLGLAITKSLVELMNGKITLTSAGQGQGTTMSFTLPLDATQRAQTTESVAVADLAVTVSV
ncbi:MAG: PAS domain S-box protein [Candidatus Neomarinimicrobiota bacterium]